MGTSIIKINPKGSGDLSNLALALRSELTTTGSVKPQIEIDRAGTVVSGMGTRVVTELRVIWEGIPKEELAKIRERILELSDIPIEFSVTTRETKDNET